MGQNKLSLALQPYRKNITNMLVDRIPILNKCNDNNNKTHK